MRGWRLLWVWRLPLRELTQLAICFIEHFSHLLNALGCSSVISSGSAFRQPRAEIWVKSWR